MSTLVVDLRYGSRMLVKAPGFSAIALITLAPVLLGQAEPLLHGLDLHTLGFCVTDRKASEYATRFVLENCNTELTTKADETKVKKDRFRLPAS